MLYKLNRQGQPTQFIWRADNGKGPALMLGTYGETVEMAERIVDLLTSSVKAPIPEITEHDEMLTPCYTVPEAISAARDQGYQGDKRRFAVTIRSAARAGRITGAYRTDEGYWRLPVAAFNAWLAEHAEQRAGRPRKEAAREERKESKYGAWMVSIPTVFAGEYIRFYINKAAADQLDAYTVEVWRKMLNGELYVIKRDSTGIVVGAFGPLDVGKESVNIPDNVDWSLDLAHSLQVDRLLGGFETITIRGISNA
jgi:hypothetical protein